MKLDRIMDILEETTSAFMREYISEQEWLDMFSDNLRDILIEEGITQRDLADEMGVSEAAVSRYVKGERIPDLKSLINMSFVLGMSLDELMDFDYFVI